jgi:lipopolysaccharide/colanic/teichoic acid biosynthesis glycosyltransferase
VTVDRIVVTHPFDRLSGIAREALREVERSSAVKVDCLTESLGLGRGDVAECSGPIDDVKDRLDAATAEKREQICPGRYHHLKRVLDAAAALVMIVILTPVLMLTTLLVAIDVGFPVVFWQQRPGKHGLPFKLFKFRTMRAAHDADGNRIPDELRSSKIGRLLRRFWLDELPQLYNILIGEMSFVGPRPLLPADQPKSQNSRLLVRPGLTGWAQINGGRDIFSDEKSTLDLWYIVNASLWLDSRILLGTIRLMLSGEPSDASATEATHSGLKGIRTRAVDESEPTLATETSRLSAHGMQAH